MYYTRKTLCFHLQSTTQPEKAVINIHSPQGMHPVCLRSDGHGSTQSSTASKSVYKSVRYEPFYSFVFQNKHFFTDHGLIDTSTRRVHRPFSLNSQNSTRETGNMNPPSPTRTPPYRQGTPPPASFHSPTHVSPVHSSPTYQKAQVPPVPVLTTSRRAVAPFPTISAAQNKVGVASPFTQIKVDYQETMQQINRPGVPITNPTRATGQAITSPPRARSPTTRPYSPTNLTSALERRNSGSSKRSSISPRTSFNNSTSATSLAEHLKHTKITAPSPPPRFNSPRVQSPLHESHSPKRRTPDRSLPLNEEHEEQERRESSQAELDVDSPDTKSPGEDADATIMPTRRSSVVERVSPAKSSLAQSKSRERLQERYQRSLEAATQETPLQRADR